MAHVYNVIRRSLNVCSEKINYVSLQVSPTQWFVVRTEVKGRDQFPHLRMEGVPPSFKGPPTFKEAHLVVLSKENILTCSCGLKHRYGIPCRHLFFLEPEYHLADIDYRYQVTYSYYAYHPDHGDITKAYKARHNKEHNGVLRKTLVVQDDLPYLSHACPFSIQEILQLHESTVPICWNYCKDEYPESFTCASNNNAALGDLTQESVINAYDSDGVAVDDSLHEPDDFSQSTNHKVIPASSSSREIQEHTLTDAQLLSKFKSVMNCHKSQLSKNTLWKLLTDAELNQKRILIRQNPGLLGEGDQEFVSLHLPIDQARESVQHSYKHSRTGMKKRKQ
jgi:hypothetical protein